MTVLRNIEQKIESLFEGVFGRAFRTNVQPVELARKLAKEMDDHRMVSVSRVYAPNEYSVYLSPADREQFESYEESLATELQEYLAEHARRESYVLLSPPKVLMNTDADLEVGEFGIATRMVQPEPGQEPPEPPPEAEPGATMVYKPQAGPPTQAASAEELGVTPEVVTLETDGMASSRVRQSRFRLLRDMAGNHHIEKGSRRAEPALARFCGRSPRQERLRVTMPATIPLAGIAATLHGRSPTRCERRAR